MKRAQVQLTEEQLRRLRAGAAERGVSVAELVREAVDRHLSIASSAEARRARAVASIGGFRSGREDVSERHDEYLEDALDA
jgi:hypothetical protein